MQHSKQTIRVFVFAALLSVTALSAALARPAPPTKEQMRLAQHRQALEEQLAEMRMKFTESNPRVAALREQIANYDRFVTPQAKANVKSRLLHRLRARRATIESQLTDAQIRYTDVNPRVRVLRDQLDQIEQQIADVTTPHK